MSEKLTNIIEQLKTLTLLEASELVTEIENVFGVDPSVSVAAASVAPIDSGEGAGGGDEKDEFDITLTTVPADKKIAVLKIVRNLTGLGLKEAKDLVEGAPKEIKAGVPKKEADEFKKKLEAAGAKVELK